MEPRTVAEAIEQLDWYFTSDDGSASENETKDAYAVIKQIMNDVAIREQESVEPRLIGHRFVCANCHEDMYVSYDYCPHCGRKVKWDG